MKKNHPWYNYNTIDARKNKNKKEVNTDGRKSESGGKSAAAEQPKEA